MKFWTAILLAILATSCATTKTSISPSAATSEYMSLRNLDRELNVVAERWRGKGVVIIGKLDIPKGVPVASRTRLFPDGSFAAAVAPNRELIFYAHGYDPIKASVYDAGTLHITPPEAKDLRSVTCSVSFSAPSESNTAATIQLVFQNTACLHQDFGHSGGNMDIIADTKVITNRQSAEFNGLSRIPYRLVFTSPGYIKQEFSVDQSKDGMIDLGNVVLEKAPEFEINYRVRIRKYGGEWTTDGEVHRSTIVCDGISEFQFSDIRDGLGCRMTLRMTPYKQGVTSSFFYNEAKFYALDDKLSIGTSDFGSTVPDESVEAFNGIMLKDGGLYYFRVRDINGLDADVIFQPNQI